jgi:hypothetical protein
MTSSEGKARDHPQPQHQPHPHLPWWQRGTTPSGLCSGLRLAPEGEGGDCLPIDEDLRVEAELEHERGRGR